MWLQSCINQGAQWGRASPFPQWQGGVVQEGELLLQAAHAEGQVARRQDEQDNADERTSDWERDGGMKEGERKRAIENTLMNHNSRMSKTRFAGHWGILLLCVRMNARGRRLAKSVRRTAPNRCWFILSGGFPEEAATGEPVKHVLSSSITSLSALESLLSAVCSNEPSPRTCQTLVNNLRHHVEQWILEFPFKDEILMTSSGALTKCKFWTVRVCSLSRCDHFNMIRGSRATASLVSPPVGFLVRRQHSDKTLRADKSLLLPQGFTLSMKDGPLLVNTSPRWAAGQVGRRARCYPGQIIRHAALSLDYN